MLEGSKKRERDKRKDGSNIAIMKLLREFAGTYAACGWDVVQMEPDGALCRGIGWEASCPSSLKFP